MNCLSIPTPPELTTFKVNGYGQAQASPRDAWYKQTLSIKVFYLLVKSLGKNSCNVPSFSSKEVTHVWDPSTFPKREQPKLLLV